MIEYKTHAPVHLSVAVIEHIPNDKFIMDMHADVHSTDFSAQKLTNDWERQIPKQIMVI